jgi:hypothetical protein
MTHVRRAAILFAPSAATACYAAFAMNGDAERT